MYKNIKTAKDKNFKHLYEKIYDKCMEDYSILLAIKSMPSKINICYFKLTSNAGT